MFTTLRSRCSPTRDTPYPQELQPSRQQQHEQGEEWWSGGALYSSRASNPATLVLHELAPVHTPMQLAGQHPAHSSSCAVPSTVLIAADSQAPVKGRQLAVSHDLAASIGGSYFLRCSTALLVACLFTAFILGSCIAGLGTERLQCPSAQWRQQLATVQQPLTTQLWQQQQGWQQPEQQQADIPHVGRMHQQGSQQPAEHLSASHQPEGFHYEAAVRDLREHVQQNGPAEDFFPEGCRWRLVGGLPATRLVAFTDEAGKAAGRQTWSMQQLEYWDESSEEWVPHQPAACRLQALSIQEWQETLQRRGVEQERLLRQKSEQETGDGERVAADWQHAQQHVSSQHQSWQQPPQQPQEQPGQQQEQHRWPLGGPASGGGCTEAACLYYNVWYNRGKFYYLSEGEGAQRANWAMSKNRVIELLNVRNATAWVDSVHAKVVPGETAAVDFVFFLHPTAIGHWLELMFPLFSVLLHGEPLVKRTPDRLLVLHQKRGFLFGWVRALMAVALGVKPGEALPPIILQQEHSDPYEQMGYAPEGVGPSDWLCFKKLLFVKDIFVNGTRGFRDTQDAQLFRRLMYEQYAVPFPVPGTPPPLTVTFQRKSANRRVLNEPQLLAMLQEFGEVRVVEFGGSTPFREQLATMATTGVYVSVHTSNLANTPFLPPGAVVFEIIQRNWAWCDIDQSFVAFTKQMGDIHHYAWRAQRHNQTVYLHPRMDQLFSSWNATDCEIHECVEAHTAVDVVADIAALRELIAGRLRIVRQGASVVEARLPWPLAI